MWLPQITAYLCLAVLAAIGRANAYEKDPDIKSIPVSILGSMRC